MSFDASSAAAEADHALVVVDRKALARRLADNRANAVLSKAAAREVESTARQLDALDALAARRADAEALAEDVRAQLRTEQVMSVDGLRERSRAATEGLNTLYRDGRITAKDLSERITDHALADKVRVTAMNGLGLVTSPEGAALLTDLLSRGTELDRRSAAILLVHQDPMTAVPALIKALGDADEVARSNAHESLRAFARGRDFGQDAAAWLRWWQSRAI